MEVGCAEKSIEDIKMALEQKERELTGFFSAGERTVFRKSILSGRRRKMKLISWNVNGIRACVQKDF